MKESTNSFNERVTEIRLDNTSELLQELEKYKDEGNSLYKEKKIEEAKLKFKEGYEKYEKEIHQIKKDFPESPKLNEIEIVLNKILSNLALCYYKQGKYQESIKYDEILFSRSPKFGKSIVRLFKSYSKLNQIKKAVGFGETFLELDQETRDKFKGTQDKVKREQLKLKNIQKAEKDKIKKDFGKYVLPIVILCLAVLGFMLFRKK